MDPKALLQPPIVRNENTTRQCWEIDRASFEALKNEDWYINNEVEPNTWNGKSMLIRWLNEFETDGDKYLECRVPSDRADSWCCERSTRLNRAIAHVRTHLGHEPYLCGGPPNCKREGCTARFSSAESLYGHRKGPTDLLCEWCGNYYSQQNLARHKGTCPGRARV